MKKLVWIVVVVVLTMALAAGCAVPENGKVYSFNRDDVDLNFTERNIEFSFDIFREINKEDENQSVFISPLSISTALTMTYQGARGTTQEAMAEALRYKGLDMEVLNESYKHLLAYLSQNDKSIELNINTSIWFREGEEINEEFLTVNKDVFDAYICELDFSKEDAASQINGWIDNATKGKIKEMIQPPIPEEILMYLINAIYFKGEWSQKFDSKQTFKTDFLQGNGTKQQVDMMNRRGTIEYGAGDDFKAVRLPYGDGNIAMYCILPREGLSINSFIENMDCNKWAEVKESISERQDIILQIPRFKLEYGIKELRNSLTNLGMGEAFSDYADFSGIRRDVAISRVLHKAVIEVNEEGSEAAAVTVVEVRTTSAMEPTAFIADRPFLFIIADDESDSILFMGKLHNVK